MQEINKQGNLNTTALAYIGDAVYEVYVRKHVLKSGRVHVDKLHQMAVKYVRADGQAKALKAIYDVLDEDEQDLVRRARNRKTNSKPKNADPVEYKNATAFEALIGCLYIENKLGRMDEIINLALVEIE
jgi:ribonuclease-3 family protein